MYSLLTQCMLQTTNGTARKTFHVAVPQQAQSLALNKTHRPCGPESMLSLLSIHPACASEIQYHAMMLHMEAQPEVVLQASTI